jgi:hypothetical protein
VLKSLLNHPAAPAGAGMGTGLFTGLFTGTPGTGSASIHRQPVHFAGSGDSFRVGHQSNPCWHEMTPKVF